MNTILKRLIDSVRQALRQRETERQLAQLDARMLRDIGLESWNRGQAGRLWAYRAGLY
jgi:uncharacterized protein YjiS (DUF1127 family)